MKIDKFVLIHIGKSGGTTVRNILRQMQFKFSIKHLNRIKYNPNKKYVIVLRNPISRFISAFNWRYHLVCDTKKQQFRFKGENKILEHYKTINSLAEDLYNVNGSLRVDLTRHNKYIHHIYEDINFYIGDFLDKCDPKNIIGVILTETIHKDLHKIFKIKRNTKLPYKKKNKKYDTYLSRLAYKNLKKYLKKDYQCIKKLYNMNLITKKQYKILSA